MTDAIDSRVHRCQVCRDADEPTALEFAFDLLAVRRDEQEILVIDLGHRGDELGPFSQGWDAGIEANLDDSTMPVGTGDMDDTRAWLVGFVAGQYALTKGYPMPSCNVIEHHTV